MRMCKYLDRRVSFRHGRKTMTGPVAAVRETTRELAINTPQGRLWVQEAKVKVIK